MLWTTPSLLSLAPGPILAVEFFTSQKPLWEAPRGAQLLPYRCSKTEVQVWCSPAPTEQAKDSLVHVGLDKRGGAVSVQMAILQWRDQGKAPVLRPDLCRPLI